MSGFSRFTELPAEIQCVIASHLRPSTLRSLNRTSRRLHAITLPFIYRRVVLISRVTSVETPWSPQIDDSSLIIRRQRLFQRTIEAKPEYGMLVKELHWSFLVTPSANTSGATSRSLKSPFTEITNRRPVTSPNPASPPPFKKSAQISSYPSSQTSTIPLFFDNLVNVHSAHLQFPISCNGKATTTGNPRILPNIRKIRLSGHVPEDLHSSLLSGFNQLEKLDLDHVRTIQFLETMANGSTSFTSLRTCIIRTTVSPSTVLSHSYSPLFFAPLGLHAQILRQLKLSAPNMERVHISLTSPQAEYPYAFNLWGGNPRVERSKKCDLFVESLLPIISELEGNQIHAPATLRRKMWDKWRQLTLEGFSLPTNTVHQLQHHLGVNVMELPGRLEPLWPSSMAGLSLPF